MKGEPPPESIELIGNTVAIRWADGQEDFYHMEALRACSPSAENVGEPDLFGRIHGGDPRTEFPGVTVEGYELVGRYAVRFLFSDGHSSGLFSYGYLRRISREGRGA